MSEPFLSEICMFAFDFAPLNWAHCDGQELPISQNTELFSLIGTTYGGDGRTTFQLPDMQARCPIHQGEGFGLSNHRIGHSGGMDQVELSIAQMPRHKHQVRASTNEVKRQSSPATGVAAIPLRTTGLQVYNASSNGTFKDDSVSDTGGVALHNNQQPTLVVNFCIALQGIFPPRN